MTSGTYEWRATTVIKCCWRRCEENWWKGESRKRLVEEEGKEMRGDLPPRELNITAFAGPASPSGESFRNAPVRLFSNPRQAQFARLAL